MKQQLVGVLHPLQQASVSVTSPRITALLPSFVCQHQCRLCTNHTLLFCLCGMFAWSMCKQACKSDTWACMPHFATVDNSGQFSLPLFQIMHNLCNSLLLQMCWMLTNPSWKRANCDFVLHHAGQPHHPLQAHMVVQAAQDYRVDPYLREACQADIEAHCNGTKPERGGVQQCLVRSLHLPH